jgi:hypothetical protein
MAKAPRTSNTAPKPDERPELGPRTKAWNAEAIAARIARKKPVAITKPGDGGIIAPHNDVEGYSARLLQAFGAVSSDSLNTGLHLLDYVSRGRDTEDFGSTMVLNSLLALVQSIGPRDEFEALAKIRGGG